MEPDVKMLLDAMSAELLDDLFYEILVGTNCCMNQSTFFMQ